MQFTKLSRKALAEWLHDAADYIEENGWWRGALRGPNGKQVCGLGGILFCRDMSSDEESALEVKEVCYAVMQAIGNDAPLAVAHTELVSWNDHEVSEKQEIIDALRKAEKITVGGFDPDKGVPL